MCIWTCSVVKRVFQNIVKYFILVPNFFYIYRTRIIFLAIKILVPHRYFLCKKTGPRILHIHFLWPSWERMKQSFIHIARYEIWGGVCIQKLSNLAASLSKNAVSPQLDFVSSSQRMRLYQARRHGVSFVAFFHSAQKKSISPNHSSSQRVLNDL
jgi:hypothetical protein